MMLPHAETPATARTVNRRQEIDWLAASISFEDSTNAHNINALRAAWIARRARVSLDVAMVVAGLAFKAEAR